MIYYQSAIKSSSSWSSSLLLSLPQLIYLINPHLNTSSNCYYLMNIHYFRIIFIWLWWSHIISAFSDRTSSSSSPSSSLLIGLIHYHYFSGFGVMIYYQSAIKSLFTHDVIFNQRLSIIKLIPQLLIHEQLSTCELFNAVIFGLSLY
jgi:hypothetical protein